MLASELARAIVFCSLSSSAPLLDQSDLAQPSRASPFRGRCTKVERSQLALESRPEKTELCKVKTFVRLCGQFRHSTTRAHHDRCRMEVDCKLSSRRGGLNA